MGSSVWPGCDETALECLERDGCPPRLAPSPAPDVDLAEPNYKFRIAQTVAQPATQRATATAVALPVDAAGNAAATNVTGGCSNATGACGSNDGGSLLETQPRDKYWWDSYGRTVYHLDRVWAPKAWDTTTGSSEVRGSCSTACCKQKGARGGGAAASRHAAWKSYLQQH